VQVRRVGVYKEEPENMLYGVKWDNGCGRLPNDTIVYVAALKGTP